MEQPLCMEWGCDMMEALGAVLRGGCGTEESKHGCCSLTHDSLLTHR